MWLLIDDERNMGCDVICRNSEAGKTMLAIRKWEGLCLDHDLGCSETGYDVLTWALERSCVPAVVELVTSNPVGRDRMGAALVAAGWIKKAPHKYIHKDHEWAE